MGKQRRLIVHRRPEESDDDFEKRIQAMKRQIQLKYDTVTFIAYEWSYEKRCFHKALILYVENK
jgi:hypothetical protein